MTYSQINPTKVGGFLLLTALIFLAGCNDGVVYLNATSIGDCVIKCKELTSHSNFHCMQADASFGTTIKNGEIMDSGCECILLDCFKEVSGNSSQS